MVDKGGKTSQDFSVRLSADNNPDSKSFLPAHDCIRDESDVHCIGQNAQVSVKDPNTVDDRCSVELKLLDFSIDHPVGSAFHCV